MKPFYVYAIKNTETDKIITWRTNPPRKFWQRKSSAQEALNKSGDWVWGKGGRIPRERLKLITLKVEEVTDEN